MNHNEAVRLQAAEKYILGELFPEDRELFEEHYFDCLQCIDDLKALNAFITASRAVLKEAEVPSIAVAKPQKQGFSSWFHWLQPAFAAPAILILGGVLAYQNLVTIPRAGKREAAGATAEIYTSTFHLQGTTRGESQPTITVGKDKNFGLDFDFTPSRAAPRYHGKLTDASGRVLRSFEISGEQANREVHFFVPGGTIPPGTYELVFFSEGPTANPALDKDQVFRLSFRLESRP